MANAIVKELNGTVVYEHGQYGQYASPEKVGKPLCWRRTITDSFNMSGSSYWVNGDDTGNTFRLLLDGSQGSHTAKRVDGGFELPSNLSLEPVGDLMN